jgi:uncharacterized RDD family membrane protein YckC/cytoskeletal protein CcmA (bactofilin family)
MNRLAPTAAFLALILGLLAGASPLLAQPAPPEPPAKAETFVDAENAVPQEQEEIESSPNEGRHRARPRQTFAQDLVVRTNETVGDLVLIGGSADIQGTVDGDLVMIGGNVKLSGEITRGLVVVGGGLTQSGTVGRDTVVVMGGADLADTARIEGNAVFFGGPFKIDPEAQIFGERQMFPIGDILPKVEWFKAWVVQGLFWGRLLPYGVTWPWYVAGFTLLFYMLVLVLFPAGVKASYLALEQRPIASLASGLLALILAAPLAVVLAMTVVGIAAIPFVKIALLLAMIVGKIGVICFLGRSVGRTTRLGALQAPFLAFVVGAILITLVYTVPVLGLPAWGLATVFGLGAALVALGNSFSREQAEIPPMPVPLATVAPSAPGAAAATTNPPGGLPLGSVDPLAAAGTATVAAPPPMASSIPADTLLLRRAGFMPRFLASLLDIFLLFMVLIVAGPFAAPLLLPFGIIYFVAMWTWKGTTLGSLVFGLKVIRTDGRPITFAVALVRSLASVFSLMVLFLGFLWAAWDREKQSWHDKIAGTVVVRMPKDFSLIGMF